MRGCKLAGRIEAGYRLSVVRAMEQVLVDHARARRRSQRGGDWHRQSLDQVMERLEEQSIDIEALHESIERLAALDSRQAEMIRMRYVFELPDQRIAEHFGLSSKTVENNLSLARAWLRRELGGETNDRQA